jgi:hypothetical protein
LSPEFSKMLSNLDTMDRRWRRYNAESINTLFAQFAQRLRALHDRLVHNPDLQISLLDMEYERQWEEERANDLESRSLNSNHQTHTPGSSCITGSRKEKGASLPIAALNNASGPTTGSVQTWSDSAGRPTEPGENDDLTAFSELLMGQVFTNMDRVISFDDMVLSQQASQQVNQQWNGVVDASGRGGGDAATQRGQQWGGY